MKNLSKTLIIFFSFFCFLSCDNDDDTNPTTINQFTVNGTNYPVESGFLALDKNAPYTNGFGLFFLEKQGRENSSGNFTVPTNTTYGIAIWVDLGPNPVANEADITDNISNTTYNVSDDTRAIIGITQFTNIYNFNNVPYGEIDETGSTTFEVNTTGSGTLQINNFTVDLTARTGTVNCTYSFLDENNNTITGQFDGIFVIVDDH